jgi:hypothetical protein
VETLSAGILSPPSQGWLATWRSQMGRCAHWWRVGRLLAGLGAAVVLMACCRGAAGAAVVVPCVGDCNGDGTVTVNEILLLAGIALGEADIATCPLGDANPDGQITIDEIIAAVNSALNGCETQSATPTPTPAATSTPTNSPSATVTPTPSSVPSGTPTPTSSPTGTATPTPSSTVTATPTPTSPSLGPPITYFGLAGQDRVPVPTAGMVGQNPMFTKPPISNGQGFYVVVEAGFGSSGSLPGTVTFNPTPAARPDLQIQADRDLGDGSTLVCDQPPVQNPSPTITPGGVPGINSSVPNHCTKDPEECVTDALNDFGCRFIVISTSGEAITEPTPQLPSFVNPTPGLTQRQYIFAQPSGSWLAFATGDTLLTVRVRDIAGNLGDPRSIVLRVPTPVTGGASGTLGP